jgi:hypothetical protein
MDPSLPVVITNKNFNINPPTTQYFPLIDNDLLERIAYSYNLSVGGVFLIAYGAGGPALVKTIVFPVVLATVGLGAVAAMIFTMNFASNKIYEYFNPIPLPSNEVPKPDPLKPQPQPEPLKPPLPKLTEIDPLKSKETPKQNHWDILNNLEYIYQGEKVSIPKPSKPREVTIEDHTQIDDMILKLRKDFKIREDSPQKIRIVDLSTEQAIDQASDDPIALNFANETSLGGNPAIFFRNGKIEKNPASNGAAAQEESLVRRSTLFLSLILEECLVLIQKAGKWVPLNDGEQPTSEVRTWYAKNGVRKGFDSTKTAFVSDNHLFAIKGNGFLDNVLLPAPRRVSFITSAAKIHKGTTVETSVGSPAYNDAKARIQVICFAAATAAAEIKAKYPEKRVVFIVGAFGCGEFISDNGEEYAIMMAEIILSELIKYKGFFDEGIFAIPRFGKTEVNDPELGLNKNVRNYNVFSEVINKHNSRLTEPKIII